MASFNEVKQFNHNLYSSLHETSQQKLRASDKRKDTETVTKTGVIALIFLLRGAKCEEKWEKKIRVLQQECKDTVKK